MAAIEFRGVTKRFPDGTIAVDDLQLTIEDGEFMIFVGPSGCGKTTALRMVAGLEHPTSGEILIGGKIVNDLDPVDRDIAMVFQNYALYPHMTVRGNIGFPLETQRMPKAEREQRIAEAASLLGLEDLLERKPGALSGGQRQRVAVLDHGVVQQVDPPDVLYNRPANTFVASFIGSPSMNFLRARIDDGMVSFGTFRLPLPETAAARLRRRDGEVIVGLRPEYFSDAPLAGGDLAIPVTVEITEQLGSETLVYFRIDGVSAESSGDVQAELGGAFVARLDPRTRPVPGEQLRLAVDVERAHFFDPADGAALRIEGE